MFTHAQESRTTVPTVTRLVKLFLDKEAALSAATRTGDSAAVKGFLADDFELRAGHRAANPVPLADWLREITRTKEPGGNATRMAVHDVGGGTAIASFNQDGANGSLFVVDVWRQQGGDWKLAIRYASPAGSPAFAIPGVGPAEPEIPKKY
jgi:hypothetical protein